MQRGLARLGERAAQDKVLRRIAGQRHFRERDEVGAGLAGLAAPLDDAVSIAVEIAYGHVDLGQGQAQLRHASSLRR